MSRDLAFRRRVLGFWRKEGRHELPWRQTTDPYQVVVSEIMLQQTQVSRVISKFQDFIKQFPTFRALARAPVQKVLAAWQGLGYNRRALNLHRLAQGVTSGQPLTQLPGVGPYTASAVLVFAYNRPAVMIETNIRRVYLHHYFPNKQKVSDKELLPIIERTLDRKNPRRWYSALMDYGAALAEQIPNPNRRSRHYTRQSLFEGSLRQLRGKVIALATAAPIAMQKLRSHIRDARLTEVLKQLKREGFIRIVDKRVVIY